ncbi:MULTISPECIES: hypothetical protein [Burkholderia]|jgi:hypothetical protein|uniref:hypothetical protein n=1 Tax=Burkholderia TaxID=32008 RepID=UPI00158EE353|nr:hypothetical protein [Burkholderia ambifaria]
MYFRERVPLPEIARRKERAVNARFEAMCGHYLFEPEFCNRTAGWEKGIVEKNAQDRRRQTTESFHRTHGHPARILLDKAIGMPF